MTTPKHVERVHAPNSPSKLKNKEISPAWIDDPLADEHPVTAEGTLCHEALDTGNTAALNDDQLRMVQMCREFQDVVLPGADCHKEVKLDVLDGMWGYADLVKVLGKEAALIDYKFGFNPQEPAESNPAAQAYVLGVFRKWPEVERVKVYYLYPRLDEVSSAEFTREDIPRIETRVRLIVEKARDATPEVCRWSAETCRFCGHRFNCPTLRKAVLPIAERYAGKHDISLPDFSDLETLADAEAFSRLMEVAPVLEALADSIKRNAVRFRQETGVEIPGYELRERAGRKLFLNSVMIAAKLRELGWSDDQIFSATVFNSTELERVVGDLAPARGKARLLRKVLDTLEDAGLVDERPPSTYIAKQRK